MQDPHHVGIGCITLLAAILVAAGLWWFIFWLFMRMLHQL